MRNDLVTGPIRAVSATQASSPDHRKPRRCLECLCPRSRTRSGASKLAHTACAFAGVPSVSPGERVTLAHRPGSGEWAADVRGSLTGGGWDRLEGGRVGAGRRSGFQGRGSESAEPGLRVPRVSRSCIRRIRAVSASLLAFHRCRSGMGFDRPSADARSSSAAGACEELLATPASDSRSRECPVRGSAHCDGVRGRALRRVDIRFFRSYPALRALPMAWDCRSVVLSGVRPPIIASHERPDLLPDPD
jgi:hypothetical protein